MAAFFRSALLLIQVSHLLYSILPSMFQMVPSLPCLFPAGSGTIYAWYGRDSNNDPHLDFPSSIVGFLLPSYVYLHYRLCPLLVQRGAHGPMVGTGSRLTYGTEELPPGGRHLLSRRVLHIFLPGLSAVREAFVEWEQYPGEEAARGSAMLPQDL